jgi:hypothetical protein
MTKTFLQPGAAALAALMALALCGAAQAQRVSRDTQGGPLRAPTAEETKALDAKAAKTAAPVGLRTGKVNPQPIKHPDGSIEQELDTSTLTYSVARRNADGSLDMVCVTGSEDAERALKGALKGPKAGKEHKHEEK